MTSTPSTDLLHAVRALSASLITLDVNEDRLSLLAEYRRVRTECERDDARFNMHEHLGARALTALRNCAHELVSSTDRRARTYISKLYGGPWELDIDDIIFYFGAEALRSQRFLHGLADFSLVAAFDPAYRLLRQARMIRATGRDKWTPRDIEEARRGWQTQVGQGERPTKRRRINNLSDAPEEETGDHKDAQGAVDGGALAIRDVATQPLNQGAAMAKQLDHRDSDGDNVDGDGDNDEDDDEDDDDVSERSIEHGRGGSADRLPLMYDGSHLEADDDAFQPWYTFDGGGSSLPQVSTVPCEPLMSPPDSLHRVNVITPGFGESPTGGQSETRINLGVSANGSPSLSAFISGGSGGPDNHAQSTPNLDVLAAAAAEATATTTRTANDPQVPPLTSSLDQPSATYGHEGAPLLIQTSDVQLRPPLHLPDRQEDTGRPENRPVVVDVGTMPNDPTRAGALRCFDRLAHLRLDGEAISSILELIVLARNDPRWYALDPTAIRDAEPKPSLPGSLQDHHHMILAPIHLPGVEHWTLAIIDRNSHTIHVFDPLQYGPFLDDAFSAAERYAVACLSLREPPPSKWARVKSSECRQRDDESCGVYILIYAIHSIFQLRTPTAISVPLWRRYLALLFLHSTGDTHIITTSAAGLPHDPTAALAARWPRDPAQRTIEALIKTLEGLKSVDAVISSQQSGIARIEKLFATAASSRETLEDGVAADTSSARLLDGVLANPHSQRLDRGWYTKTQEELRGCKRRLHRHSRAVQAARACAIVREQCAQDLEALGRLREDGYKKLEQTDALYRDTVAACNRRRDACVEV